MSDEPTLGMLSRRTLLSGLGTAGAVTLAAAVPPTFGASSGVLAAPIDHNAGARPQALAPLTSALVDPSAFQPVQSSAGRFISATTGGVTTTPGTGMLTAQLDVPAGARIRELRVVYQAPSATPDNLVRVFRKALSGPYTTLTEQDPLPRGDGWLETAFSLDELVDGTSTYMVGYLVAQAGQQFICSVTVGYEEPQERPAPAPSPAPGFIAITPTTRVLDTRVVGGKLTAGEQRVVPLNVPGSAAAAVINLTVTETEQFGYLSVYPANSDWPGNSSINWSSSQQDIANTVISAVDANGQIRIRAGVSSTQVVIDVLGYFT